MLTPEEIKSHSRSRLEKLVDEALESGKKPLTLTQIEDLALGLGGEVEQEISSRWLEQPSTPASPSIPHCPTGGRRMHPKGKKRR
jgi:hypothetical protein